MKKSAFTLAEILISLMILGVIASLTIPSLIQNTSKKEQIVQVKKGLSMINQAVSMNYALTGEDLTNLDTVPKVIEMLKKRLSVVAGGNTGDDWVRTQDGLTYFVQQSTGTKAAECGATDAIVGDGTDATGNCYDIIVSTKNASEIKTQLGGTGALYSKITQAAKPAAGEGKPAEPAGPQTSVRGALTGYYQFYAGADRVVPSTNTQAILNATDASKASDN